MTHLRIRQGPNQVGDRGDKYLVEEVTPNGMIVGQLSQPLLPTRRPAETRDLHWNGQRYHLCVGINPHTGRPAEAFLSGAKAGSEMDALIDDAMIALSKLLQAGADPQELASTFGGQSIIGAVAQEIAAWK